MNEMSNAYYDALKALPRLFAQQLQCISPEQASRVSEIRLRSGRVVMLTAPQWHQPVVVHQTPLICTHTQLQECFQALCGYSVHSMQLYVQQGFLPVKGGHRAGICGTVYYDEQGVLQLKNITGITLRIARTQLCITSPVLTSLAQKSGGVLFVGEPSSGKTTLLRSFVSALSTLQQNVCIVDERFELAPVDSSGFQCVVPDTCDYFSGYPKHIGVMHALRSMAPDVIVCDEIGTLADVEALQLVCNAGVRMVASVHGDRWGSLQKRTQIRAILETKAFSFAVFLEGKHAPSKIKEVKTLADMD